MKEGDNVAKPLESTKIFPGMVTSMIEVGEETGELPKMLVRIADNDDEEVDNAVDALTSIIEPVMIVMMAVGVGIIVIAMFLPMVEPSRASEWVAGSRAASEWARLSALADALTAPGAAVVGVAAP